MRLVSWNVNGLRACVKKGFLDYVAEDAPDVLCLQETRLKLPQVPPEVTDLAGYEAWWHPAERAGYSGVGLLSKAPPVAVERGFGPERFTVEGRTLVADYGAFLLVNGYFPNGGKGPERLAYKLDYYAALLDWVKARQGEGRSVVVTGDLNTAHEERDLARPKQNRKTSGFMDCEREWLDHYRDAGLVDTFRLFEEETGHYTWWSQRFGVREKNIGWRIDYFWVTADLVSKVKSARILPHIMGSDHCPIDLVLDL
jgi:exodeoxyribonuclease-3